MQGTLIESPDSPNVFWHYMDVVQVQFETYLDKGVKVYWDLGLVSVNDRLLKIDKNRILPRNYTDEEMKMNVALARGFAIRRLTSHTYYRLGPETISNCFNLQVGLYVLFFSSTWKHRTQVNENFLRLYKWLPGLRTCDQMLVRLQRAWRRRQSARRALALGMAFHCRLGEEAEVACLGADLYRLICGGL
jgi:hypothetical protein